MFGISLPEIVLILLVIIVFVRPEDLPGFLRSAGRFYGKAKRMYKEITGITNRVLKEVNSIASLDDPPPSKAPKEHAPLNQQVALPPADLPESSAETETEAGNVNSAPTKPEQI